jgi:transcriptional regulator
MDVQLLWGTLDLLILEVVARGPTYGYRIARTVVTRSRGRFDLKEGSLYPALHRMERARWLASTWVETPEGRRRKYYRITAAGRRELERRREEWKRFSGAVSGVLGGGGE